MTIYLLPFAMQNYQSLFGFCSLDSRDELFATDLWIPRFFLGYWSCVEENVVGVLRYYPIIYKPIMSTCNKLPYCRIVSKLLVLKSPLLYHNDLFLSSVSYWRKCDWSTASLCSQLEIHHNDLFFICCCSSLRSLWRERDEKALWPDTKETAGAHGTM